MRMQWWDWSRERRQQVGLGPFLVTLAVGVVVVGCSIPYGASSGRSERAAGSIAYAQGVQPTQGMSGMPSLRTPEQPLGQRLQQPAQAQPSGQAQPLRQALPPRQVQSSSQVQPLGQVQQSGQAQQLQGSSNSQSPFAPAQGRLAQSLQGQETQTQVEQADGGRVAPEHTRRIVVAGTGEVKVAPNVAHITLGVEGQAPRAREALSNVSAAANNVIAALRQIGIPERQIQTAAIELHPIYETPPAPEPGQPLAERQGPPPITGYRAVNRIRVRMMNLDQLGGVIDAAIDAGANIASGIQFSLENDAAARQEALRQAVQEARSEAMVLAEALGVQITGVRAVVEEEVGGVLPLGEVAYSAVASRAADVATPVQPGEITVRKQVQVIFDIG